MLAGGWRIPHLCQQKPPRLCLYLPRTYEWQSWMRLDQTIAPWTALWLFYFEEWLASDDWKGGGMHPETDADLTLAAWWKTLLDIVPQAIELRGLDSITASALVTGFDLDDLAVVQ